MTKELEQDSRLQAQQHDENVLSTEEIRKQLTDFYKACFHLQSQSIQPNPYNSSEDRVLYTSVVEPYRYSTALIKQHDHVFPDKVTADFIDEARPDLGWMLQLNVEPGACGVVAEYLKNNAYHHTFLQDGSIERGQIFTIRVGSFAFAKKIAPVLADELSGFLAWPPDEDRVELARGVTGYFTDAMVPPQKFHTITSGFSWTRGYRRKLINLILSRTNGNFDQRELRKKILQEEAEFQSFQVLSLKYGSYFYDGEF